MQENKLWNYEEIDCPKCGGTGDYASGSMGTCGKCDASDKIKTDYLITDSPVLLGLFIGEKVVYVYDEDEIMRDFERPLRAFVIDSLLNEKSCLTAIKLPRTIINKVIDENPLAELLFNYGLQNDHEKNELWAWRCSR